MSMNITSDIIILMNTSWYQSASKNIKNSWREVKKKHIKIWKYERNYEIQQSENLKIWRKKSESQKHEEKIQNWKSKIENIKISRYQNNNIFYFITKVTFGHEVVIKILFLGNSTNNIFLEGELTFSILDLKQIFKIFKILKFREFEDFLDFNIFEIFTFSDQKKVEENRLRVLRIS